MSSIFDVIFSDVYPLLFLTAEDNAEDVAFRDSFDPDVVSKAEAQGLAVPDYIMAKNYTVNVDDDGELHGNSLRVESSFECGSFYVGWVHPDQTPEWIDPTHPGMTPKQEICSIPTTLHREDGPALIRFRGVRLKHRHGILKFASVDSWEAAWYLDGTPKRMMGPYSISGKKVELFDHQLIGQSEVEFKWDHPSGGNIACGTAFKTMEATGSKVRFESLGPSVFESEQDALLFYDEV